MSKMKRRFAIAGVIITVACFALITSAQQSVRGSITGTVSADEGQVHAFRVGAHNLDRGLWYTVFTKNGQYTVPQALPGLYELMVEEPGYISPKVPVYVIPGEPKTANIALKKQVQGARSGGGEYNEEGPARRNSGQIVYVSSMDEVYPAGPERDLLKQNCTGCHSDSLTTMHYTKEGFLRGIEKMTETGPAAFPNVLALGRTAFSNSQKEQLAQYLAKNFGPGMPGRKLRVDPLEFDENVAARAIYVSYDVPAELPLAENQGFKVGAPMIDGEIALRPGVSPNAMGHLQAAAISPVDGSVWFTARNWNSLLALNPKELDPAKRWRNYPVKGEWVAVSGVTLDSKGKVYWSELDGGMLGELDPASGKQIRYVIAQKGVGVGIMADKDDNIDFALIWGALFGRLDAKTHMIHTYPTPTPDNGIYGLAVDQQGNMWGAGWQKGTISKWDAETGVVKEYPVPDSWGQIRRIGVDSKGVVWASAYNTGYLVKLDPTTDKMSEYKIPASGANPYDAWPDKDDNTWTSDETHSAVIKLDTKSNKFTFYPMPQPHQSIPKIELANDNTFWFGTRGEPIVTGVHFYPDGYTATAQPQP